MTYTGLTAKLTIGNDDIAYISNWSVEETRDVIEVTQLGSKNKKILPSLHYWTASAEGAADFTSSSGQKTIRDAMVNGTVITAKFYLDESTHLVGNAIVTAFSVNISSEDKGGVSISLTGDGELTLETAGTESSGTV